MTQQQLQVVQENSFLKVDTAEAIYNSTQTGKPLIVIISDTSGNDFLNLDDLKLFEDMAIWLEINRSSTQFDMFTNLFPQIGKEMESSIAIIEDGKLINLIKLYESVNIINILNDYFQLDINDQIEENSTTKSRTKNISEYKRVGLLIDNDKVENLSNTKIQQSNECTLRIKLDDSKTITHTFNSCTNNLKDVKEYIETITNKKIPRYHSFHRVLPKKRFNGLDELKSLNTLDLMPRSTLYLIKNRGIIRELRRTRDSSQDFKYISFFIMFLRNVYLKLTYWNKKMKPKTKPLHSKSLITTTDPRHRRSYLVDNDLSESSANTNNNQN